MKKFQHADWLREHHFIPNSAENLIKHKKLLFNCSCIVLNK